MGNKPRTTRPTIKTQPRRILSSGEAGNVGANGNNIPATIRIKLVHLDLAIMQRVSVQDNVTVVWEDGAYYCLAQKKILGKVPSNYNSQLIPPNIHRATIVELQEQPPSVIIEIIF